MRCKSGGVGAGCRGTRQQEWGVGEEGGGKGKKAGIVFDQQIDTMGA